MVLTSLSDEHLDGSGELERGGGGRGGGMHEDDPDARLMQVSPL